MLTTTCPHCGAVLTHLTPVDGALDPPANVHASICVDCYEVAVFDLAEPANLRKPTDDEQAMIDSDPGGHLGALLLAVRDIQ